MVILVCLNETQLAACNIMPAQAGIHENKGNGWIPATSVRE